MFRKAIYWLNYHNGQEGPDSKFDSENISEFRVDK